MTDDTTHRLNKHLALTLGVSRREADALIEKGSVLINDKVATLGARFETGDDIRVKGKLLAGATAKQYVAFHKPTGYVCSRKAQGDAPTIYSLLPPKFQSLKTVGRLDKDSSGLILLTNDGDFSYTMTHPKFHKIKIYDVELNSELEPLHQQMISDFGIQLEDGPSKLQLARLNDHNRKEWQVTMSEGRNRQIRRTFSSLGYTVTKLHRIQFGTYSLGALQKGKWQEVNPS